MRSAAMARGGLLEWPDCVTHRRHLLPVEVRQVSNCYAVRRGPGAFGQLVPDLSVYAIILDRDATDRYNPAASTPP